MKQKHSDYMYWVKTQRNAPFNLATSGVGPFPLRDLHFDFTQAEINGDNKYGYLPLKRAIARKSGADPDSVVTAAGCSMANYLAMATLLDPGDQVLIEHPTYELLVSAALYIGAEVKRFSRTEESGYALDPAQVRRAITPKTRLIVVTNLHNPSSALASNAVLGEIADLAASVGGRLLVDEIYLDAVYEDTPQSAFHLGPEVIVTNSLTKLYGLHGLRCGWVLAQPDTARAMWRLNDLFGAAPVYAGELLSVAAFQQLDSIRERARKVVEADRRLLDEFFDQQSVITAPSTRFGTVSFCRLRTGNPEQFLARLHQKYETSVVPGRFFEMPDHFRIGMGVNTNIFREGLRRIRLAAMAEAEISSNSKSVVG